MIMNPVDNLPDPKDLDNWNNDVALVPSVTWLDVTSYLVDTPSIFSKTSLRAYKSLEAYDYFVCGHVQDCFYHAINDRKFYLVRDRRKYGLV